MLIVMKVERYQYSQQRYITINNVIIVREDIDMVEGTECKIRGHCDLTKH